MGTALRRIGNAVLHNNDWLRELIWVTREQDQYLIKDMTDSHLYNAIAWITRYEDRLDGLVDRYWLLAMIASNEHGEDLVAERQAEYVSETVAWFKLCREGMKLEQDYRRTHKQTNWKEMRF